MPSQSLMTLITLLNALKTDTHSWEVPRLAIRLELNGLSETKRAVDLVNEFNLIHQNWTCSIKIVNSTVFLHFK